MGEKGAGESAKKTSVAKAKKSTEAKAKKGVKGEALPRRVLKMRSYLEMVTDAIATMNDRSGSSRPAITRSILETHKIDATKVIHIRKAISTGIEKGVLKQARASGKGAGSFKLVKEDKPKKAVKPNKKLVVKKIVKASSAGASSVKKNLQKKTFKKVVKETTKKGKGKVEKVATKKVAKKADKKNGNAVKKPDSKKTEKPAAKKSAKK